MTPGINVEELGIYSEPRYFARGLKGDHLARARVNQARTNWEYEPTWAIFIAEPTEGQPANTPLVIDSYDRLRQLVVENSAEPTPGHFLTQAVHGFFENGGEQCCVVHVASGAPSVRDAYLSALQVASVRCPRALVCAPDLSAGLMSDTIDLLEFGAVQQTLIDFCESSQTHFAILDAPPGMTPDEVRSWRQRDGGPDTSVAALYYPGFKAFPPNGWMPAYVPPCGHVAGVYARTDLVQGVHCLPANEPVMGVIDPDLTVTRYEHGSLNPIGINVVRRSGDMGIRVWGARTLSSDPMWRLVHIRRIVSYIRHALDGSTRWVLRTDARDPAVWAQVEHDVGDFLDALWRAGALVGTTTTDAFYVHCNSELNGPDVQDAGQLTARVGLSLWFPNVFLQLRVTYQFGS